MCRGVAQGEAGQSFDVGFKIRFLERMYDGAARWYDNDWRPRHLLRVPGRDGWRLGREPSVRNAMAYAHDRHSLITLPADGPYERRFGPDDRRGDVTEMWSADRERRVGAPDRRDPAEENRVQERRRRLEPCSGDLLVHHWASCSADTAP